MFPEITSDRYVAISVADTGLGMEAEIANRVFEPFFTTNKPEKEPASVSQWSTRLSEITGD
jgi:signal transduction histidine kinase